MGQAPVVTRTVLIGLSFLLSQALSAQELLWERVGVKEKYHFGWRLAVLGDVDKDGYDDLLHIVKKWPGFSQLWFLSGKDGSTIRIRPELPNIKSDYWGIAAAGDMNGDGTPDYAVLISDGKTGLLVVEVASGKDDRTIWKVVGPPGTSFGDAVLGNLDLDGDRKPDLVVVEPLVAPFPRINAYANNGKLLYSVSPSTSKLIVGCFRSDEAIGKVGDINKDGADDFVVGACEPGVGGAGAVLSGKTGKVLLVVRDVKLGDNIGHSMDGCGDMDGDGVPDLVVGSTPVFSKGVVHAFSGKTGKVLQTWRSKTTKVCLGRSFAQSLKSGGIDADRDGVPDVMVGAQGESRVYVFSGRDGSEIWRFESSCFLSTGLGDWIATLPPQPGNPFPLLAVSEHQYGTWCNRNTCSYLGRLRVFRGSPSGARVYGAACKGTLNTTPEIGIRDLYGKVARIHLSQGAPGSPALPLLGLSRTSWGRIPLPLALDPLGFTGCKLYTSVDLMLLATTGSTGISRGYTFLDLGLHSSSNVPLTLHGQWFTLGTGPLAPGAFSDAVRWSAQ